MAKTDDAYRGMLMTLQSGHCALCGYLFVPRDERTANYDMPTKDHVWPKSKGGYDGPGNLLLAHAGCNRRKDDKRPTGCEIIWLCSVLEKEGRPFKMKPDLEWIIR